MLWSFYNPSPSYPPSTPPPAPKGGKGKSQDSKGQKGSRRTDDTKGHSSTANSKGVNDTAKDDKGNGKGYSSTENQKGSKGKSGKSRGNQHAPQPTSSQQSHTSNQNSSIGNVSADAAAYLERRKKSGKGDNKQTTHIVRELDIDGTPIYLERDYVRILEPSEVRSEKTLQKAFAHIKKNEKKKGYDWSCEQLKNVRQELTHLNLCNEFVIEVYAHHARIALQNLDLDNFNQCQSQLRGIFWGEEKFESCEDIRIEFTVSLIFYLQYNDLTTDISILLQQIVKYYDEFWCMPDAIEWAMEVRQAMVFGRDEKISRRAIKSRDKLSNLIYQATKTNLSN